MIFIFLIIFIIAMHFIIVKWFSYSKRSKFGIISAALTDGRLKYISLLGMPIGLMVEGTYKGRKVSCKEPMSSHYGGMQINMEPIRIRKGWSTKTGNLLSPFFATYPTSNTYFTLKKVYYNLSKNQSWSYIDSVADNINSILKEMEMAAQIVETEDCDERFRVPQNKLQKNWLGSILLIPLIILALIMLYCLTLQIITTFK